MEDRVNHPSHYTGTFRSRGVECIDITRHMSFDRGNAIKYIWRAGLKDSSEGSAKAIEDLRKAKFYIEDIRRHGLVEYDTSKSMAAWSLVQEPDESDRFNWLKFKAIDILVAGDEPYTDEVNEMLRLLGFAVEHDEFESGAPF